MIGMTLVILGVIAFAHATPPNVVDPVCDSLQYKEQLVPHEDCDKFYQCTNGVAVVKKCAADLHFSFVRQVCDHPEYANCKNGPPQEQDKDNEVGYQQEATVECLAENSEGFLLPHGNCNQFYKCANRVPVPQDCPEGLYYDPARHICEWAHKVNCGDRSTEQIDDEIDSNANEPAVICASGSPRVGLGKLPHEDCNFFYECNAGMAEVTMCPRGLLFNAKKGSCGRSKDPECGKDGRRKGMKHRPLNDLYKVE